MASVATLLHGYGSAFYEGVMPISLPGISLWILDLVLRFLFLNSVLLVAPLFVGLPSIFSQLCKALKMGPSAGNAQWK
jgi:hypothetical protein